MFSIENVEERIQRVLEEAEVKLECERDDEEAFQIGIMSFITEDGISIVDMNYCCGRHLLMAVATIKNVAEIHLSNRQNMTEDEIQEEWEYASKVVKDNEDLGEFIDEDDDLGWLRNVEDS